MQGAMGSAHPRIRGPVHAFAFVVNVPKKIYLEWSAGPAVPGEMKAP